MRAADFGGLRACDGPVVLGYSIPTQPTYLPLPSPIICLITERKLTQHKGFWIALTFLNRCLMLRAPSSRAPDPLWHWHLELGKLGADATIASLSMVATRKTSKLHNYSGGHWAAGGKSVHSYSMPPPKQNNPRVRKRQSRLELACAQFKVKKKNTLLLEVRCKRGLTVCTVRLHHASAMCSSKSTTHGW
jgi:hypothetical protein